MPAGALPAGAKELTGRVDATDETGAVLLVDAPRKPGQAQTKPPAPVRVEYAAVAKAKMQVEFNRPGEDAGDGAGAGDEAAEDEYDDFDEFEGEDEDDGADDLEGEDASEDEDADGNADRDAHGAVEDDSEAEAGPDDEDED